MPMAIDQWTIASALVVRRWKSRAGRRVRVECGTICHLWHEAAGGSLRNSQVAGQCGRLCCRERLRFGAGRQIEAYRSGARAVRTDDHFLTTDSTQLMKFVVESPVRSAWVCPWAHTVAKSTSRMP